MLHTDLALNNAMEKDEEWDSQLDELVEVEFKCDKYDLKEVFQEEMSEMEGEKSFDFQSMTDLPLTWMTLRSSYNAVFLLKTHLRLVRSAFDACW